MPDTVSDSDFIKLLAQSGAASPEQIEDACRQQTESAAAGTQLNLADTLVGLAHISDETRDAILHQALEEKLNSRLKLGNYRILRKIGAGGMGIVFLAQDELAGRQVALKVLPRKYSADREFITRFRREAKAAGKLSHPNIVSGYTVGEDQGSHFFAMEYYEGEPLDAMIRREGALPWDDALKLTRQAALGLQHAHDKSLIHRDIKPANIFITRDGVVKILDLGLSKNLAVAEASFQTQTGIAMGTPHYMSPEQVRGDRAIDGRTDIYSLGATLYQLLTNRTPFEGTIAALVIVKHLTEQLPDPRAINPQIPASVVLIIQKMMARHPQDRYVNCGDLVSDIDRALDGQELDNPALPMDRSSVLLTPIRVDEILSNQATQVVPSPFTIPPTQGKQGFSQIIPVPSDLPPTGSAVLNAALNTTAGMRSKQESIEVPSTLRATKIAAVVIGLSIAVLAAWMAGAFGPASGFNNQSVQNSSVPLAPKTVAPEIASPVPEPPLSPAEVSSAARWARAVELLPLVEVARDTVSGEWEISPRALTGRLRDGHSRLEFPYEPPREYDFRIDFSTGSKILDAAQVLSRPGTPPRAFRWVMRKDVAGGFDLVQARSFTANPTTQALTLESGARHISIVQVRENGVKAYVNGGLVSEWRTDYADLEIPAAARLRSDSLLGLSIRYGEIEVYSAQVLELSGSGKLTRPNAPGTKAEVVALQNGPVNAAWISAVQKLPAKAQVEAVYEKMSELNPGVEKYTGYKVGQNPERVTEWMMRSAALKDASPLRALQALTVLQIAGALHQTSGAFTRNLLSDLTPIKGMKLTTLNISHTSVSDLSPLSGMPLNTLDVMSTRVSDLSPLRGMQLHWLQCVGTQISDLAPLEKMPIRFLNLQDCQRLENIQALAGMPLEELVLQGTRVTDLSPLSGTPLKKISVDYEPERHQAILKALPSLEKINGLTIEEFWRRNP